MCSNLITDFTISFLTIKATPCWCLSLRPLYHITLPLSVTFSPVPFHLSSSRHRIDHPTYLFPIPVILYYRIVVGFEHSIFLYTNI